MFRPPRVTHLLRDSNSVLPRLKRPRPPPRRPRRTLTPGVSSEVPLQPFLKRIRKLLLYQIVNPISAPGCPRRSQPEALSPPPHAPSMIVI